jgi:hypothetical protein
LTRSSCRRAARGSSGRPSSAGRTVTGTTWSRC